MGNDLRAIDREIQLIEESARRLKELGDGIETVGRNADAIMTFTYILRRNVSDLLEE